MGVIEFYKSSGYYPGPIERHYTEAFQNKTPFDVSEMKQVGHGNAAKVYLNQRENIIYKIPHSAEKMPSLEVEGKVFTLLQNNFGKYHIKVPRYFKVHKNGRYLTREGFAAEQLAENMRTLSSRQIEELQKTFAGVQEFVRETGIGLDFKAMNLAWDGAHWVLFDLAPRMGYLPYGFTLDVPNFTRYLEIWQGFDPPSTGDNFSLAEMQNVLQMPPIKINSVLSSNKNSKIINRDLPRHSSFVIKMGLERQFDEIEQYIRDEVSHSEDSEYLLFRGANSYGQNLLAKKTDSGEFAQEIKRLDQYRLIRIAEIQRLLERNEIPPDKSKATLTKELNELNSQTAIDWLSREHSETMGNDYLISASEDLNIALGDIGALTGKRKYIYVIVVPKQKAIPIWKNIFKLGLRSKVVEKEVAIPLDATPYVKAIYDIERATWIYKN